jgi:PKD repeat protein
VSRRALAAAAVGTALALAASPLTAHAATAPRVVKYAGKAAPAPLHALPRAVSPQTTNGLTAAFIPSPTGLRSFSFDATQSTDTESTITGYSINYGDGTSAVTDTTGTFAYTYARAGSYTVTLTVTDAAGSTDTATTTVTTAGSDFTPYGPTRLLDTRDGTGQGGTGTPVGANSAISLKIGGNGSIPADATAVVINLTAVNATANGVISAYPAGVSHPNNTSNLNYYAADGAIATLATVQVGTGGDIDLYNNSGGTVDLIGDVTGYFTQTSSSGFTPLTPARILDTRTATGGHDSDLAANSSLALTIASADGGDLPSSGITAVALNLTTTNQTANGALTAYPDGTTRPGTSTLNYRDGINIANYSVVPVGADGKIEIYNSSTGPTDVIADVTGYFSTSSTSSYIPVTPTRSLDTRDEIQGTVEPDTIAQDPHLTSSQNNASAYAVTATVIGPSADGDLIIYPAGSPIPSVSNINWADGVNIANSAYIAPGSTGIYLYNQSPGTMNVTLDEYGYYSAH